MGTNKNNFSCIIFGESSLSIRCAEILLREGNVIRAIVSADPETQKWSRQKSIPSFPFRPGLAEQITEPFDYLFSIVNPHILRDEILLLPRKLAINYHDAPLPRYAGTHATSWAIINGESSHGITWHTISDVVDAGDILKQRIIEIDTNETALTLNTKCYEAAATSFLELVSDLSTGSLVGRQQDLEQRSFFPRFKRPQFGGLIVWDRTAAQISALVRGLSFGNHPNPLGTPKLNVGKNFFVVHDISVLPTRSTSEPGTICKVASDSIQVSTRDYDIAIHEVRAIEGQAISLADFVSECDLHDGFRFGGPENVDARRVENLIRQTCKDEAYWVAKLSSLNAMDAPYANSPIGPAPKYSKSELALPDGLQSSITKIGGLRAGTFVAAAFCALISRLGRLETFDIGFNDADFESEIQGYGNLFQTQLPLRISANGQQSFAAFILEFQNELELIRNRSTYCLDTRYRYPQLRTDTGEDSSLPMVLVQAKDLSGTFPTTGADLVFRIAEDGLRCDFIFNQNRIDTNDISRLSRQLEMLLTKAVEDTNCALADLPILTPEERHQILFEWNNNELEYPKELCVHELFEAQVARSPELTALIFGDQRLSYRELNCRANKLAGYLRKVGVRRESLVGICVERSVEMIVGILGILKAGGTYVPLDPNYPKERLDQILDDSQAGILVASARALSKLGARDEVIVCMDTDADRIAAESRDNPALASSSEALAYVIYTSGSTGKPKGVAIEHRNASALIHWALSTFDTEQLAGVLASTSVCFDLSVFEIFVPLSCGGKVILVENVLHLPEAPAANEVTLVNTVPSAMTELLRGGRVSRSVRTVNLAGEPLKSSLVEEIYRMEHVREVFDLYGPTEDTTYSTFSLRNGRKATIGRPISNTQAYIVDQHLQPVPVGIIGELYLSGDGLAREYLNRPDLTSERFVPNVFKNGSERMYKTGDLARFLPSGEIEYIGRADNQVKIRGFRIELGEIETLLAAHHDIAKAVVVAREDKPGDKKLVAYFVPNEKAALETNDLREYLKQKLPDYMVPSAFVELGDIPLTPNGKTDIKALPAPATVTRGGQPVAATDCTPIELRLIKIWESILDSRGISVNDNFFDLGGHSLQAIRMFSEIEEEFGKNIPLATLFEASTIKKLARILQQDGWSPRESSLVPIQPEGTRPPFFCIHAKGGNVLFYNDLARWLGKDQPFYGLQARRLGGRQLGHSTVEEMADYYISEIQTVQPAGPYALGGSSFGGLVAFEMAKQLEGRGERVSLLALLDTGAPGYPRYLPNATAFWSRVHGIAGGIQKHRDSLAAFSPTERVDYVVGKLKKVKLTYSRKIRNKYKAGVRRFYSTAAKNGSIPTNYIQLEDQIWRAGEKYSPEPYDGKVTLFRASHQPWGIYPDATLGWDKFVTGELEIHEVAGHHGSIVTEPYVRELAKKLRECLERAQVQDRQVVARSSWVSAGRSI